MLSKFVFSFAAILQAVDATTLSSSIVSSSSLSSSISSTSTIAPASSAGPKVGIDCGDSNVSYYYRAACFPCGDNGPGQPTVGLCASKTDTPSTSFSTSSSTATKSCGPINISYSYNGGCFACADHGIGSGSGQCEGGMFSTLSSTTSSSTISKSTLTTSTTSTSKTDIPSTSSSPSSSTATKSCGPINISYSYNGGCFACADHGIGSGSGQCEGGMFSTLSSTTSSSTSTSTTLTTSTTSTSAIAIKPSAIVKLAPVVVCSGAATCKPGYGYSTVGSCTLCKVGTYSKGVNSVCITCPGANSTGAILCPIKRVVISIRTTSSTATSSKSSTTPPPAILSSSTTPCVGACTSINSFTVNPNSKSTSATSSTTSVDPNFHVDCQSGYQWPDNNHKTQCVPIPSSITTTSTTTAVHNYTISTPSTTTTSTSTSDPNFHVDCPPGYVGGKQGVYGCTLCQAGSTESVCRGYPMSSYSSVMTSSTFTSTSTPTPTSTNYHSSTTY